MYLFRCEELLHNPPPKNWKGIFQKRFSRHYLEDVPAHLSFETTTESKIAILMKNVSESGVLIMIGHEYEFYIGECVIIEILLDQFIESSIQKTETFHLTCSIRRKQLGSMLNQCPTMEFGLEFMEESTGQKLLLQEALNYALD